MNRIATLNSMPSYCSSFYYALWSWIYPFCKELLQLKNFHFTYYLLYGLRNRWAYHVRRMKQSYQDNHLIEKHSFERRNSYFLWNFKLLRKLILRSSKWNSSLFYLIRGWDDEKDIYIKRRSNYILKLLRLYTSCVKIWKYLNFD